MNTKTPRAVLGAVVAVSLVANAVMAQQAGAGKPRQEFKGPVKVFILAGQSNMEGHGGVKTLDRLGEHPTHGYLLKKIRNDDGSFVVRDDVFVSYQKADEKIKRPLSVGMGAWGADWFGPELMFGIEIATCPELKGTVGYVRTAPFWYPELDELPRRMESEEHRVRKAVAAQLKEQMKDKPESADPKKMEQLVKEAGDKALKDDAAYQKAKTESDKHVCNWYCHYQGSARVYCMVGYSLAEAMKPLLTTKP